MLYRLNVDLSFNDEEPLEDIWDKLVDHIGQACTINPGQENQERGFIRRIVCGHADHPNDPCQPQEEILSPLTPCQDNPQ